MISRTDIEDMTDAQDEARLHIVKAPPAASIIRIGELVDIRPDGTITYGPNYSPDEAAKALWDAIARMGFARLSRPSQAGDAERVQAMRDANWRPAVDYWRERAMKAEAALAAMDTPKGGGDE